MYLTDETKDVTVDTKTLLKHLWMKPWQIEDRAGSRLDPCPPYMGHTDPAFEQLPLLFGQLKKQSGRSIAFYQPRSGMVR